MRTACTIIRDWVKNTSFGTGRSWVCRISATVQAMTIAA